MVTLIVSNSLRQCRLWPARLLCQVGGFYMQEYWWVLASAVYHTLLEPYVSFCPSCELPWVPGAARTPVTQAVAPPHQALTGANPSPPGQPQEQTPVDDPYAQVKIKPQLKPRGLLRKKIQHLPTTCTSCRLNTHDQLGRLCVYGIYKRTLRASRHIHTNKQTKQKCTSSDSCEYWKQEHIGGPD